MTNIRKKIAATPDIKLPDDDHLKRGDITEKEFVKGADEIYEANKDKPAVNKKNNRFAKATIKALNDLK